jgi:hypothetical protein
VKRAIVVWLVPICAFQIDEPVFAGQEANVAVTGARSMRVYVAGAPAAVAKMSATLRELCARLDLDVIVEEASDETAMTATGPNAWLKAFVDVRSTAPRIVVVDAETRRELERRSLPASRSLEMSVEEAAHVLYMVAESALAGRDSRTPAGGDTAAAPSSSRAPEPRKPTVEPSTRSAPQSKPPREPPRDHGEGEPLDDDRGEQRHRKASARFQSELAAFGTAAAFGAARALVGFGGSLDAGARTGSFRVSGALSGSAYLPSRLTRGAAAASLSAESARVEVIGAWAATSVFEPFFAIGGGADRIALDADSPPPGASPTGVESRMDPIVTGALGAKIRLSRTFGAFFAFATDVDLSPHRYVIDADGAEQTFLELARIRPALFVGVSVSVAGGSAGGEARP